MAAQTNVLKIPCFAIFAYFTVKSAGIYQRFNIFLCGARSPIQLAGKISGGATDAMVHPDACFHIDCHGRYRICERREL